MVIKVSALLSNNTNVVIDTAPALGGPLNTNNYPIQNNGLPVNITGNTYPISTGTAGQVLTTDGNGTVTWQNSSSTSVTLIGDITGSGISPINTTLSDTGVLAGAYGSSSYSSVFTVNSSGRITEAHNSPISITPTAAGLGNVTNALQVINNGGTPSIEQGTGNPSPPSNLGAIYVDRDVTNGNGIYYYNGTDWKVVATKPNLYNEKSINFTVPTAQGANSIALGAGAETSASAPNSLAIGMQSLARHSGCLVQSNGRFATNGDAQVGRYLLRTHTISMVPTEMFINGTAGGVRLVLPDDATWTFKVTVTAHRTDLDNGHAGYMASGVIYRGAGPSATFILGSIQKTVLAESNPVWDINIGVDNINGSLKVMVTGENSKTIRWLALVETVEITN